MDNDRTYEGFSGFYHYEQSDGNRALCVQEVYVLGSNSEESKEHKIICVQTVYNILKKVREYKFGSIGYEAFRKDDRVQILQEFTIEVRGAESV